MERHKQGGRQGFRGREDRDAETEDRRVKRSGGRYRGGRYRGHSQSPRGRGCDVWGLQWTLASLPQMSLEGLLLPQCRTLPKNGVEVGQGAVQEGRLPGGGNRHWRGKLMCEQSWGRHR